VEEAMKKNLGSADKIVRVIVGLVLILLVFVGPQTPWGWIGIIPLATVVMSWCPIYAIFKFSTAKKEEKA
jgi:hypothetical protein